MAGLIDSGVHALKATKGAAKAGAVPTSVFAIIEIGQYAATQEWGVPPLTAAVLGGIVFLLLSGGAATYLSGRVADHVKGDLIRRGRRSGDPRGIRRP